MTLAAHYKMFGHYNAWANRRLYDAASRLTSEQYRADCGAFFKSVHGTLNNLLATDRIWMRRFTREVMANYDQIRREALQKAVPPAIIAAPAGNEVQDKQESKEAGQD